MGEESNLEKRLIFSGTVSVPPFEPVMVANPIPGVKLYDGLCLNEFDPELEWTHDESEPIGRVMNLSETNETLTFDVDCVNQKIVRRVLGLPEKPLSKLKRRRKTFKKALMAYGYSRDKAENICRLVAMDDFGNSYARLCEHMITFRGR